MNQLYICISIFYAEYINIWISYYHTLYSVTYSHATRLMVSSVERAFWKPNHLSGALKSNTVPFDAECHKISGVRLFCIAFLETSRVLFLNEFHQAMTIADGNPSRLFELDDKNPGLLTTLPLLTAVDSSREYVQNLQ